MKNKVALTIMLSASLFSSQAFAGCFLWWCWPDPPAPTPAPTPTSPNVQRTFWASAGVTYEPSFQQGAHVLETTKYNSPTGKLNVVKTYVIECWDFNYQLSAEVKLVYGISGSISGQQNCGNDSTTLSLDLNPYQGVNFWQAKRVQPKRYNIKEVQELSNNTTRDTGNTNSSDSKTETDVYSASTFSIPH